MEFDNIWEVDRVIRFITANGFRRATLQFPDTLLHDSPIVASRLRERLAGTAAEVYILADVTYNSLSVDEVAAAHVHADCVIHYGPASLNPVSRLPTLIVLPKSPLDISLVAQQLLAAAKQLPPSKKAILILPDQSYQHAVSALQAAVQAAAQLAVQTEGGSTAPMVFAEAAADELWPPHHAPPANRAASTTGAMAPKPQCGPCGCSPSAGTATTPHTDTPHTTMSDSHTALEHPSTAAHPNPSATSTCTTTQSSEHQSSTSCPQCPTSSPSSEPAPSCSNTPSQPSPPSPLPSTSSSLGQDPEQPGSASCGGAAAGGQGRGAAGAVGGWVWSLPEGVGLEDCLLMWVGSRDAPALSHLQLTYSSHDWVTLDPSPGGELQEGLGSGTARLLKRRYFLMEKAKEANIVGILVGTLAAAGYREALNAIRRLAHAAGKKTYTMLMGKPNPAKLANFPEVEVWVMVADPQGLVLESRDYLAPIITPFEAHLAFTDQPWPEHYRLDYEFLVDSRNPYSPAPLLNTQPTTTTSSTTTADTATANADTTAAAAADSLSSLALTSPADSNPERLQLLRQQARDGKVVVARTGAEYLVAKRSYQGLETPATGAAVKVPSLAVEGRFGRAAVYEDEPSGTGTSS